MDKTLSTLGLAYRAKKVIFGEEVLEQIQNIRLMFIASDISEKSRERFEKKCLYYNIEHIDVFNSNEISNALGKDTIKVVGITDEGFAKTLLNK